MPKYFDAPPQPGQVFHYGTDPCAWYLRLSETGYLFLGGLGRSQSQPKTFLWDQWMDQNSGDFHHPAQDCQ